MSLSFVAALEQGEKNAGLETVERLARALGVDPAELVRSHRKNSGLLGRPEDQIARLVASLCRGADARKVERFGKIAKLYFAK